MAGLLTGPASESLQRLFVPASCLVIFFLGYTSQWLFNTAEYLEPGLMTKRETSIFNILLICLWWTYYKACTVPPGRYDFPPPPPTDDDPGASSPSNAKTPPARWCKKCAAPKPLRAHHCRHCGTCIPKMDHHCPWTANCVSLQTFPYFLRLLVYANLGLAYLHVQLLYPRLRFIFWDNSRLPAYLGPSVPAVAHLALLALLGGLASLAMGVLLLTTFRSWALNQTMIEGWEVERHEAVLLRAQRGGWWSGPGGVRVGRVEFPYDLGFFDNMAQAMGTRNILSWLDPFVGGGPVVSKQPGKGTGWEWEENGFNDREGMWPPPDPDKRRRAASARMGWPGAAAAAAEREDMESVDSRWRNPQEEIAAFKARQEMDQRRRKGQSGVIAELEEDEELEDLGYEYVDGDSASGGYDTEEAEDDGTIPPVRGRPWFEHGADGEPGWTNSEGDRLRDYGVDEDAEDEDEDVPLGELLRRRKAYQNGEG